MSSDSILACIISLCIVVWFSAMCFAIQKTEADNELAQDLLDTQAKLAALEAKIQAEIVAFRKDGDDSKSLVYGPVMHVAANRLEKILSE